MVDISNLLTLAKDVAGTACRMLRNAPVSHEFSETLPREMKAVVDRITEEKIIQELIPAGLPILTEERGEVSGNDTSELRFIVDPLDGTFNFIRGLGTATVSIALCHHETPLFGVLAVYPGCHLAWGGVGMGSFIDGKPIRVSNISEKGQGVLCTGFPSRFEFNKMDDASEFISTISEYAKVRMLGSASISLLKVAEGAADVYMERNIMIWDVAAGLAIVEGAGGSIFTTVGTNQHALDVVASNGVISIPC